MVPGTQPASGMSGFFGSITGRRKLPDRGTMQSRSLDYPNTGQTLETVVEAGRGVRKLPAQPGSTTLGPRGRASSLWKGVSSMQSNQQAPPPMVAVQGPTPVNNGFGPNQPVNNGFGPNQPMNNGFGPNQGTAPNGFVPNQGTNTGFGPLNQQGTNNGFGPNPPPGTNNGFVPNQVPPGTNNGFGPPNQGTNVGFPPNQDTNIGYGPNQPMNNGFVPNQQPMNNGFGPPQQQQQQQQTQPMNNSFIPNNGYVPTDDLQLRPPEWT